MGFLSSILAPAASIAGGIFGGPVGSAIGGALGGALSGKSGGSVQSGTQTVTQQQQLDPRIQAMLFGDGTSGNQGLLSQYQQLGQQPQNANNAAFGGAAQNFLGSQGGNILGQLQQGASNLSGSNIAAPSVQNPAGVVASQANTAGAVTPAFAQGANMVSAQSAGTQINAPAQNSLDLKGAYDRVINSDAGANPYLMKALTAGVDATNSGYQRNLSSLTDTLQKNILPGIRSNSVLSGQYGGSRQGIAEGNALSDFTKQATDANLQLGLQNSANTIGAQAQAFGQGQDRSLAALQGLSGQQYGVAGQNAALQQQNNISNAQLQNQTGLQVSGNNQQANLANAGFAQQAALANQAAQQQTNLANAGLAQQANTTNQGAQQQTSLANLQAQLGTNSLNSANQATGLGALSGVLGNAYGYAQNQDNFALNRAGQTNSLLAPYLSANSSSSTNTPLYSNPGGNILGGAAAGLGLYNQFANLGGGSGSSNTGFNTFNVSPGTAPVNTGALQDLSWLNNIGR